MPTNIADFQGIDSLCYDTVGGQRARCAIFPRAGATITPTTVITGPLGVGKTTALLQLITERPDPEPWAVIVNDAGRVDIDGATLASTGVTVREVAGGCVCCINGPLLRVHVVRLLREFRPARLLVETSGLAMPGPVIDQLRDPGLHLLVGATITLVAPRGLRERIARDDVVAAQVDAADILVANRTDQATPEDLDAFRDLAAHLWPPRAVVAETAWGHLDRAWLDVRPAVRGPFTVAHLEGHADDVRSFGRTWPSDAVFHRRLVVDVFQQLMGPEGPALRAKAIFRTTQGWVRVDGTPGEVRVSPTQHRRDSRLEVLARVDVAELVSLIRPR